jgi:hypothetical protein
MFRESAPYPKQLNSPEVTSETISSSTHITSNQEFNITLSITPPPIVPVSMKTTFSSTTHNENTTTKEKKIQLVVDAECTLSLDENSNGLFSDEANEMMALGFNSYIDVMPFIAKFGTHYYWQDKYKLRYHDIITKLGGVPLWNHKLKMSTNSRKNPRNLEKILALQNLWRLQLMAAIHVIIQKTLPITTRFLLLEVLQRTLLMAGRL